jgi:predicted aspartyl protease
MENMRVHLSAVVACLVILSAFAGVAAAYSGPGAHAIPVQVWNGHLWVEIALNGQKTKAIIDTGCNSIVVPPALATSLRLPVTKSGKRVAMFDKQTEGMTGVVGELRLGDLIFRDQAVDVIGYPYPIIGLPILAKYACSFDFDRSLLTLAPSPMTQSADAEQISLVPFWGLYAVKGFLSGRDQTFIVDTGADTTIASLQTVAQIPRTRIMASPEHHLTYCRFQQIRIGHHALSNPEFAVYDQPDTAGNTAVNTGAIMLGLPYWQRYNVTFDFPAQRMSMTLRKR